jgi:xanthine phosphoribosyltransferase
MRELARRIEAEGVYLGDGIVKIDGLVNHRVDPVMMRDLGEALARGLVEAGARPIGKVVTAEAGGIVPGFATALALGVPLVFARKRRPVTMPEDALSCTVTSRTRGNVTELWISPEYLGDADDVVLVDDFVGSGRTLLGLADVCARAGARLRGIACVVGKAYEDHHSVLAPLGVPVVTAVEVDVEGERVKARALLG